MLIVLVVLFPYWAHAGKDMADTLNVYPTGDFPLNGKGDHPNWSKATWNALQQIDSGVTGYTTQFKVLYSPTGIYVLFHGRDRIITTGDTEDFDDLFNGDVFEVFFHPDPTVPLYFEYEINALGRELVLLIPNFNGNLMGWRPWHYEGSRRVQKEVHVDGGKAVAGATIQSWSAELYFPFELLRPLNNVPPARGTSWRANFCRLDYDTGVMIKWSWSPVRVSFHEFQVYKTIIFQ